MNIKPALLITIGAILVSIGITVGKILLSQDFNDRRITANSEQIEVLVKDTSEIKGMIKQIHVYTVPREERRKLKK